MEILIEIDKEEAEKLGLTTSSKISFEELKRKLAAEKMQKALKDAQALSKEYGLDKLSEEDVLNIVKEAKENYNTDND